MVAAELLADVVGDELRFGVGGLQRLPQQAHAIEPVRPLHAAVHRQTVVVDQPAIVLRFSQLNVCLAKP